MDHPNVREQCDTNNMTYTHTDTFTTTVYELEYQYH